MQPETQELGHPAQLWDTCKIISKTLSHKAFPLPAPEKLWDAGAGPCPSATLAHMCWGLSSG